MLIIIIAMLTIMMVIFIVLDRSRLSIMMGAAYLGLIMVIFAYALIWAKNGALLAQMVPVLYLSQGISRWMMYLPISSASLSKLLIAGKSIFLGSSMLWSIYTCQPHKRLVRYALYSLAVMLPILNYVLLHPNIFDLYYNTFAFRNHQTVTFNLIRTFYVMCLLFCLVLMLKRYWSIRISWLKSQFYYVVTLNIYIYFLFFIFGVLGPIQISHYTGIHYLYSNFLYIGSVFPWIMLTAASLYLVVSGLWALWDYSRISMKIGRPDVTIDKKLRNSNDSVRMFTHGMKNQLLVLRAMLHDTREEPPDLADLDRRLGEMSAVCELMLSRMDELYSVFKHRSMVLCRLTTCEVVEHAMDKLGATDIAIELVGVESLTILADLHHLSEAIYNILKNAVDAVKVSVRPNGHVLLRVYQDGRNVIFEVSDTGDGIDPMDVRRIFEPFYTSKNSTSNWGIGLAYVQQVIKAHFGQISIDSRPGMGTSIYISIPPFR